MAIPAPMLMPLMDSEMSGEVGVSFVVLFVIGGLGVIALVVWLAMKAHKAEQARILAVSQWATSRGLMFVRGKNSRLHTRFRHVNDFSKGDNPYCDNVVSGEIDLVMARGEGDGIPARLPMWVFDFHYETYSTDDKGHRTTHHHWSTYCVIHMPVAFPYELVIRPENFLDKMAGFVGFGDINFESAEFSRKFHVKSTDRKFAYDVVHPLMMEYLLSLGSVKFELESVHLSQDLGRVVKQPHEYDRLIGSTIGFAERLPGWLVRQHS